MPTFSGLPAGSETDAEATTLSNAFIAARLCGAWSGRMVRPAKGVPAEERREVDRSASGAAGM